MATKTTTIITKPQPKPRRRVRAQPQIVEVVQPARRRRNRRRSVNQAVKQMSGLTIGDMSMSRPDMAPLCWSQMGNTNDGRDWAMTALDPCGPISKNQGIADSSGSSTCTPAYRSEKNITFDTSMFSTTPPTQTTYSVCIVSLPIPEINFLWKLRADSTGTWSNWNVQRTDGMLMTAPSGNPQVGVTMRSIGYGKYRLTGKGLTIELDAPDLSNQGRITSGQLESIVNVNDGTYYGSQTTETVGQELAGANDYQYTLARVPLTSQFLVNGAPSCYQGQAKEGAYVVHKFVGPLSAQQYQNTGEFLITGQHYAAATGVSDLMFPETFLAIDSSDGPVTDSTVNDYFIPAQSATQFAGNLGLSSPAIPVLEYISAQQAHPFVSRPCDMTTSVTFIENVAVAAGIRVKSRVYMEAISTGAGAISPFAHKSPLLDQRALDVVATVAQQGQDAYPARYNSFGEILGKIWEGMKTVATPVLNVAKFIPGAGAFANMGLAGINSIDAVRNAIVGGSG